VTVHWAAAEPDGDCLPDWEPAPRYITDLPDISEWNGAADAEPVSKRTSADAVTVRRSPQAASDANPCP